MWLWLAEAADWLRHRLRLRAWAAPKAWGRRAEDLAMRHLQRQGFVIVARNVAAPGHGEVDLLGFEGPQLVFVEVKSRWDERWAPPQRALTLDKRRKVAQAARTLARRWGKRADDVRFDAVLVVFAPYRLEHERAAWGLDDLPIRTRSIGRAAGP